MKDDDVITVPDTISVHDCTFVGPMPTLNPLFDAMRLAGVAEVKGVLVTVGPDGLIIEGLPA